MSLLLQYYRRYVSRSLEEPEAVIRCTRDYQRTNDHMADFVDTCVERVKQTQPQDEGGDAAGSTFLGIDEAFNEFKEWAKADDVPFKPSKKVLQKYLDRALVRSALFKGRVGYRGFRLRDRFGGDLEEDEDRE